MAVHELLSNAGLYHDQAERMQARAMTEENLRKRQVMRAIAEYYYLLHDQFVELGQLQTPSLRVIPTESGLRQRGG